MKPKGEWDHITGNEPPMRTDADHAAAIAALESKLAAAEAEAKEWRWSSEKNGSEMIGYQTRAIVAEKKLSAAEARIGRLQALELARREKDELVKQVPFYDPAAIQEINGAIHGHKVLCDIHNDLTPPKAGTNAAQPQKD